jgi:hypothetical protein
VLQGAPPVPGLNRGKKMSRTNARAGFRTGWRIRFKPPELLTLHGSHLERGSPLRFPAALRRGKQAPFCIRLMAARWRKAVARPTRSDYEKPQVARRGMPWRLLRSQPRTAHISASGFSKRDGASCRSLIRQGAHAASAEHRHPKGATRARDRKELTKCPN